MKISKSEKAIAILAGLLYVLLALAINTALIDVVVSIDPRIGFEELDRASRIVTAIGISFPISLYIFRQLKQRTPSFSFKQRLILCASFFLIFNSFITVELRSLINHYVEKTSSTQRSTAVGAVVSINAYAHGLYTMSNIGLKGVELDNTATKIATVYFIPYLALSGKLDKVTNRSGNFATKLVYRAQQKGQPIIESKLDMICREGRATHSTYLAKSKEITTGFFVDKKKEYFFNYRDEQLGYEGSLGLGLGWDEFIAHRDIQMTIREKIAVAISDSIMPSQLEYIFPKPLIVKEIIGLFDRKYIDPCINYERYMHEYGEPLSKHIGGKIDDIVLNQNWANIPAEEGIKSIGEKAVYALLAPPVGIMWTLIMSTIAIGFLLYKVMMLFRFERPYAFATVVVFFVFISIMPFFYENKYTNIKSVSDGFELLRTEYSHYGGGVIAPILEWSLRYAPIIYPVGYFSREHIVGVFTGLDSI